MASGAKGTGSKIAVWIILVLLIIGLAGFGATNFGGTVNSIGKVGDRDIDVQRYARDLQNQIAAFSGQIGQNLTFAQAQQFGIDQAVLQQLVSTVALEDEADKLGLSAGDEEVRTQVLSIPAFQGLDGNFDREAYRFTLERNGQTEKQFEDSLRSEIARTLVQGAVASGLQTPDTYVQTLFDFVGERRDFTYATLNIDALETPIVDPTEADLRGYFDANSDDFMLPETRDITYAWVTPDMIVDSIDVDEDALKALYDERIEEYNRPERRLVERLILGDAAADAKARLDAGEVTFEDLVAERDLELADIDLGDMTQAALGDAGEAVFALAEPGVTDPVDTSLGAALFRVNAILAAQETPFEDARAELLDEYALDRARRVVGDELENVDDLLAGGATLEELANETDLQLGQIDWSVNSTDGIAGFEAFRAAAAAAAKGDFPEALELEDGGLFALRVNEIIEPRLQDFADAQGQAESGWRAQETATALAAQAAALADQLGAGDEGFPLELQSETDITREGFIANTPPDFLDSVFEMNLSDVKVIEADTAAYLVRLDAINPPDETDTDLAARRDQLAEATAQAIGTDLLQAYANAIQAQAGISINQAAINAVHVQFP